MPVKQLVLFGEDDVGDVVNCRVPERFKNVVLCMSAVDLLAQIGDGVVDLIVADPMCAVSCDTKCNEFDDSATYSCGFDIVRFLQHASRALVDGGAMYLFCGWRSLINWWHTVEQIGLTVMNVIVWDKSSVVTTGYDSDFSHQYGLIAIITKGIHLLRGCRYSSIWRFERWQNECVGKPGYKPTGLIKRIIMSSTVDGGWVVDCFCGTGVTGIACQETGRVYTLCDVDPVMVDRANENLFKRATCSAVAG